MNNIKTKFTREKLYEEVWQKPMTSLAKEYGLSDVGLRKICVYLQIPLPPQGYHLRKRRRSPPTLPAAKKDTPLFYYCYHCRPPAHLQDNSSEEPIIPELAFEEDPANRISVPLSIDSPHPLIKKSAQAFKKLKPDDKGRLNSFQRDGLNISVYPESVDRSLLIMDTLIKAITSRGFKIDVDSEKKSTNMIIIDESIEICMEEKSQRVDYEPTPQELKKSERLKFRTYPMYAYISSDRLAIKATTRFDSWETIFSDREKTRFETNMNKVIARLIIYAQSVKERRLKREKEEQERRAKEEHRQEMRRLIELEKAKLKELNEEVDAWHKSQRIRKYVAAVKQAVIKNKGEIAAGSELEEWLIWAEKQADRLDPLAESPYSILDDEAKYRFW